MYLCRRKLLNITTMAEDKNKQKEEELQNEQLDEVNGGIGMLELTF